MTTSEKNYQLHMALVGFGMVLAIGSLAGMVWYGWYAPDVGQVLRAGVAFWASCWFARRSAGHAEDALYREVVERIHLRPVSYAELDEAYAQYRKAA